MSQVPVPQQSVGPIAVQLGLITPEQLEAAQARKARTPGRSLDQTLVELRYLTPAQVRSIHQEMNKGAAPAPAKITRRHVVKSVNRTPLVLGGVGAIVVIGLVAFFALRGKSEPAPETSDKPAKPVRPETPAQKPQEKPADKPAEKPADKPYVPPSQKQEPELRIRVTIRKLPGHSDLVSRFNSAADKINSMRDPEQYKPVLGDLEALIKDSSGNDSADDIKDAYRDVIEAIKKRGEQVFGWLSGEVASYKAAGRYGDALKTWEWFPGNLDLVGSYGRKIEEQQKATRTEADAYFGKAMGEVEALVKAEKLEEAHLLLEKALEIGIDELYAKAERRMTELTRMVDDAIKKKHDAELLAFEKLKEAEKEAAKAAALYQDQFWKLVSSRNMEGAAAFLAKQRAGATPEVDQALAAMEKVLQEVEQAFALVGRLLQAQSGKGVIALGFVENGKLQNRSFQLKEVRGGKIVYMVEGRELSVPLTDLHAGEIAKQAAAAPAEDRDFLTGVARFMDGAFDEAHVILTQAGNRAQGLVAFVEKSSSFLERNVPVMKQKIERLLNEKQWELAIVEYTRLASVPAQRKDALKGRARAYYQVNNFMGCVSDIDALFDMDDFSDTTIELLNQAYKRSAFIDKAIRLYEKANARVPQNVSVLANLVGLYMQIHEFQKAKDVLARADKLSGGGRELAQYSHLVNTALEPAFPGKTYRAQFGRYDVETNVSQEYGTKMARFMDKVYQSYIKVFPYKKNETLRFHLKLFSTEGEFFTYYKRCTGADPAGPYGKILAYYMPITKELVGWNADDIEETLQHEGLHQYFDYFIAECPIWFNEGYASFFETSTADAVRFNPGRHSTAEWLRNSNQLPTMKEIFMMSGDVFRAKGAFHYGSSWSVVYWFVKSGRKKILDRYFEALMEGLNQQQAFDAIFGPGKEDVNDFNAKWLSAVRTGNYDQ